MGKNNYLEVEILEYLETGKQMDRISGRLEDATTIRPVTRK